MARKKCFANDFAASPADFPFNYTIDLAAGQAVRVAVAWDALSNGPGSDPLGADPDLQVFRPAAARPRV